MSHRNARLTVHARLLIVERYRAGWAQARIAEQLGVSRATVKKWVDRYDAEGMAGLEDLRMSASSGPTVTTCFGSTWGRLVGGCDGLIWPHLSTRRTV